MAVSTTFRYFSTASTLLIAGLFSLSQAIAAGPESHAGANGTGNAAGAPVLSSAPAAVPDQILAPADQALVKDVLVLENRFFCHHYGHDPMEKRIERLELITLGSAQAGSNAERLARLKLAVVNRDKSAAKTIARESQKPDGELASKTNYPILGTLEWRILKKTYASEAIDPRLARMETQLFGMPAQSMSYVDRIERLKKTIGMDIASTQSGNPAVASTPFSRGISKNQIGQGGPLPRAHGGGLDNGFRIQIGPGKNSEDGNGNISRYIYDDKGNVTGWYQSSQHSWSWPGNSSAVPGPSGQQNVFEAMDQMNRQMNQMMRQLGTPGLGMDDFPAIPNSFPGGIPDAFPGGSSITPFSGSPLGQPASPNGGANAGKTPGGHSRLAPQGAPPSVPQAQPRKFTQTRRELPAYTDPNSI
ncbi:MAG: hypothetical protein KGS72_02285 [Cyanobacteria bacterium REEB67]|nr:hypothetical protein [Cyanobacteria bacterium REEB67]